MMALVESWLGRHSGASVTVEIEGDRLTLGGESGEEARPLLEAWLERHGGS
jgi:protein gp37